MTQRALAFNVLGSSHGFWSHSNHIYTRTWAAFCNKNAAYLFIDRHRGRSCMEENGTE